MVWALEVEVELLVVLARDSVLVAAVLVLATVDLLVLFLLLLLGALLEAVNCPSPFNSLPEDINACKIQ